MDVSSKIDLADTVPEVVIKYEIIHTIDGNVVPGFAVDQWPPGATGLSIDALMLTFNMQGVSVTSIEQDVQVEDINAAHANEATRAAWWRSRVQNIRDEQRVRNLTISNVERVSDLPRMVVNGAVADWMEVDYQKEAIKAIATYELWEGNEQIWAGSTEISDEVTATNAVTKTYRAPQSIQEGDPIPVGLAEFLYNLSQGDQWGGMVRIKERQLTMDGIPALGTWIQRAGRQSGRP